MSDMSPNYVSPTTSGMTRGQGAMLVSLLTLILFAIAPIAFQALQAFTPHQFEYKIAAVPDESFETEMNSLGREGWECISARRASSGSSDLSTPDVKPTFSYEMIFKRTRR